MFREKIRAIYEDLSSSNQKLANFILDNYHQAAFMSTNEIGDHLDIDPATAVRFAQRLGYSGFPDLRDEMRDAIQEDLNLPTGWPKGMPMDIDSRRDMMLSSLQVQIENLKALQQSLQREPMEEALEMITQARRIYIAGEGISRRVGELLVYGLHGIGFDVRLTMPDFGDMVLDTIRITPDDLFIGIACTTFGPRVNKLAKHLRQSGVPVLGLVGAYAWPLARSADVVLTVPTPKPVAFTHFATMTMLVKAIVDTLGIERREVLYQQAEMHQQISDMLLESEHGIKRNATPKAFKQFFNEINNGSDPMEQDV